MQRNMRVLILSCNTGEGHNSAARAIAEVLDKRGIEYRIEDALSCFSKEISNIVSKSHVMLYKRAPKVFGVGYRLFENHPPEPGDNSKLFALLAMGRKKIHNLISDGEYSVVISTHVFAAMMVTKALKDNTLDVKSYFIPTDYTCYPGLTECELDKIFIPHESILPIFLENGIAADKLVPCRIPIKQAFFDEKDKVKARKKLGLPQNKTIVLLACGSMGCGPIKNLAEQVLKECTSDTMVVAICGSNKKLFGKLTEIAENNYDICVVGFTNEMPLYMAAADLIVTKPGGLSSTEAATMGLPMIFVDAVPGCETHNLAFYTEGGFGKTADSLDGLVKLVKKYAGCSDARAAVTDRLNENFSMNGAEIICNQVIRDFSDMTIRDSF